MGTADATVLSTSLKSVKLPGSTCVLLYMAITSSSLFHFIHKGRLTPRIAAYERYLEGCFGDDPPFKGTVHSAVPIRTCLGDRHVDQGISAEDR